MDAINQKKRSYAIINFIGTFLIAITLSYFSGYKFTKSINVSKLKGQNCLTEIEVEKAYLKKLYEASIYIDSILMSEGEFKLADPKDSRPFRVKIKEYEARFSNLTIMPDDSSLFKDNMNIIKSIYEMLERIKRTSMVEYESISKDLRTVNEWNEIRNKDEFEKKEKIKEENDVCSDVLLKKNIGLEGLLTEIQNTITRYDGDKKNKTKKLDHDKMVSDLKNLKIVLRSIVNIN